MALAERDLTLTPEAIRAAEVYQGFRNLKSLPVFEITNPHPSFVRWRQQTAIRDQLQCVAPIIAAGLATDLSSAFQYHNDRLQNQPQDRTIPITTTDLDKRSHWPSKKTELRSIMGEELGGIKGATVARHYGTVGHRAIPELLSGKLFDLNPAHGKSMRQLAKMALDNPDLSFAPYLGDMKKINAELREGIKSNDWVLRPRDIKGVLKLRDKLKQVFGHHLEDLGEVPIVGIQNYGLTLMTWASAVEHAIKKPPMLFFGEKAVLPFKQDVWAGKADALEVLTINGKPPTREQLLIIEGLAERNFTFWTDIIGSLNRAFGPNIKLRVVDWKMCIGDGNNPAAPITKEKTPLQKHIKQTYRYITFGTLAYFLSTGEPSMEAWPEDTVIENGRLIYFLPGEKPVIADFPFPVASQEEFFRNFIADNFKNSRERASARDARNAITRHAVSIIKGQVSLERKMREVPANYTLSLPFPNPSVAQIIEKFAVDEEEVFLDLSQDVDLESMGIIAPREEDVPINLYDPNDFEKDPEEEKGLSEVIVYRAEPEFDDEEKILQRGKTKKGEEFNLVHYENLLKSIRNGRRTKNFDPKRGGYVDCFNPDHEEKTPSHWIIPEQGKTHCFGCGCGYLIAKESIPVELNIEVSKHDNKSLRGEHGEILVPEEHHEIMLAAGELMKDTFSGSVAERYVRDARKIDPNFALAYGAGYGTNRVIIDLVKSGYTFDQLKQAGLFAFSTYRNNRGDVTSLFKKHGMTEEQLMVDGKYPFFILCDRVTFPLLIEDKITSYYGRALWDADKKMAHVKLPTRFSGVAQAAFNMDVLYSGHDDIIIVEGIFDALTLLSMGYHGTMGLVGTHNWRTMAEVARTQPKRVGIGLDNDKEGSKVAFMLMDWLREGNFKGETYNFTSEFLGKYPNARKYDDYNTFWIKEAYRKYRKAA
jgi:5S rRNA maturation endonuclease (ribonuclease M5)